MARGEEMIYFVIQKDKDKFIKWCETEDVGVLVEFCQYHIDNAVTTDGFIVGIACKESVKTVSLDEFCAHNGIKKRTFEERMGMK